MGVNALRAAGLVRQESIAVSIAQYNKRSTTTDAQTGHEPAHRWGTGAIGLPDLPGVPIPFIFQEFQLDIRTLTASRQLGAGLDLETGAEAAYQVALAEEKLLFRGTPAIAVADQLGALTTIYGYTTHPDRNTGSASDWGDPTNGYKNTMSTIEAMKAALRADFYPGPYWLYVNSAQWGDMHLTNTATDRMVMEVIRNDPEISRLEMSFQLTTRRSRHDRPEAPHGPMGGSGKYTNRRVG